jgi:hypothetical protein
MAICTPDEVRARASSVIYHESFGTGDGNAKTFYLKIGQETLYSMGHAVIDGSQVIYVDETEKVETTDYAINLETGKVTFVSAPADTAALSGTFEYTLLKHIKDTRLTDIIASVQRLIENQTGFLFEESSQITEKYDQPLITRRAAFGMRSLGTNVLELKHYPITSLDALTINGTSITTSTVYLQPYNYPTSLELSSTSEVSVFTCTDPQGIEVKYKYGHASDSTKPLVAEPAKQAKELTRILVLLECAGVNIYDMAWASPGMPNFGTWQVDRSTYLTPGENQLRRWTETAKTLFKMLPKKVVVR